MSNLHLLANYCNNKDDGAVKQYYKSKHLFQGQNILVTKVILIFYIYLICIWKMN